MTEPERPITRYCIHCGGIVEFAFLHDDLDEDMTSSCGADTLAPNILGQRTT